MNAYVCIPFCINQKKPSETQGGWSGGNAGSRWYKCIFLGWQDLAVPTSRLEDIAVKVGETYFLLTTEGMDMTARSKWLKHNT